MLVQNEKYKEGDILLFKMKSQEEIIAKYVSEEIGWYTVKKPATLMVHDAGNGQVGVDLQPSLFSMDINKDVDIMKTEVTMIARVRKDMSDAYIKSTSGIEIAGAGALNGLTGS